MATFQEKIDAAIALLPPAGQTVEFNEFKGNLYATDPDSAKDVFTNMLKNKLVKSKVKRGDDGKMIVTLQRPE